MKVHVLTLFPEMFAGVFGTSILGKAQAKGIISLNTVNFRDFSGNKHGTVDDAPYGGGGGMVLKPEPIFAAVEHIVAMESVDNVAGVSLSDANGIACAPSMDEPVNVHSTTRSQTHPRIILMCPQGVPFTQQKAEELAKESHLIFICGHYEGYDERIRQQLVTDELSIGDYVLTGGELPAMTVIDSIVRLLPGVLGNETSAATDSFQTGLLEYPQYTRPPIFRDMSVPDVLLSGHHMHIEAWRRQQSLRRTLERRPELLEHADLTEQERKWLLQVPDGVEKH